jgi:hypothetical protein
MMTTSPGSAPATTRVLSRWAGPRAASTVAAVTSLVVEAGTVIASGPEL